MVCLYQSTSSTSFPYCPSTRHVDRELHTSTFDTRFASIVDDLLYELHDLFGDLLADRRQATFNSACFTGQLEYLTYRVHDVQSNARHRIHASRPLPKHIKHRVSLLPYDLYEHTASDDEIDITSFSIPSVRPYLPEPEPPSSLPPSLCPPAPVSSPTPVPPSPSPSPSASTDSPHWFAPPSPSPLLPSTVPDKPESQKVLSAHEAHRAKRQLEKQKRLLRKHFLQTVTNTSHMTYDIDKLFREYIEEGLYDTSFHSTSYSMLRTSIGVLFRLCHCIVLYGMVWNVMFCLGSFSS